MAYKGRASCVDWLISRVHELEQDVEELEIELMLLKEELEIEPWILKTK
jgi:hypothetical protein